MNPSVPVNRRLLPILFLFIGLSVINAQQYEYVGTKSTVSDGSKSYYFTKSVTLTAGTSINGNNGDFFITPLATNPPPSTDQNYVRVEVPRIAVATEAGLVGLSADDKSVAFSYSDELGRTVMTSAAEASPIYQDVIQHYEYDPATGKQNESYLPYVNAYSEPGAFIPDSKTQTENFYASAPSGVAADTKPFSITVTEDSPLGRVKSVLAPGADWHTSDKKTTYDYMFYNGAHAGTVDEVFHWQVGNTGLPERGTAYGSNSLRISEMTTPDGRKSQTIVDGRGLQIATRAWDGTGWNATYQVYDDLGRLRYIIPPKVAQYTALTPDEIVGFLFEYRYDERGRVIESRNPGAGWTYAVYDEWNRLVMTRHDEQKDENDNNTWTFYKYDIFNRQVMTGLVTTSKDRATIQTEVTGHGRYEDVTTSAIGYTLTQSFPDLSHADYDTYELHTIGYFDSYDFLTYTGWDAEGHSYAYAAPTGFTGTSTMAVAGLVTGGKVRVLGTSTWLNVVTYYDDRLRTIQTVAENHLGYIDRYSSEVDYVGQVQKTYMEHAGAESVSLLTEYSYDHTGRPLQTHETIDGGARVLASDYKYNVLGELIEKNIHSTNGGSSFLQSVDYAYNIQGWLKSINDTQLTSSGDSNADLFGMELNYTNPETVNGQAIAPSYDGNIASATWNQDTDPNQAGIQGGVGGASSIYGYSYNALNQLEAAHHATDNAGSWTGTPGHYDMTAQYDPNGNTTDLTRKAEGTTIDNLDYTYSTTSNRLTGVEDLSGNAEGMDDYFTAPTDYGYDDMGNRTSDLNKEIVEIRYNHLQQVDKVVFGDNTTITYLFDAAGSRLQKTITDADGNTISSVDYAGGVEYLDGAINQIYIEGGRAYKQNGQYHREYFLTDYQGNNRVAFGELPERNVYTATMEDEDAAFDWTNVVRVAAENHTPKGTHSVALNNAAGRSLGPAKVLDIQAGDEVDLSVWAKYKAQHGTSSVFGDVLTSLLTMIGGTSTDGGAGEALSNTIGSGGSNVYVPVSDASDASDAPDAYLTYLFYDDNYVFVPGKSSFVPITNASLDAYAKLETAASITFNEPGHLFVYVANESLEDQEVYFDDLRIIHENSVTSFKVSQVNEYYPYGLPTSNTYRAEGYIDPGLLYQASYADYDALTGNYDFLYRSYDPALGQFFAVDPLAGVTPGQSPYHANYNNPVMYTDPLGLCPDCRYGDEPVYADSNPHASGGGYGNNGFFSGNHWSSGLSTSDHYRNRMNVERTLSTGDLSSLREGQYTATLDGGFSYSSVNLAYWVNYSTMVNLLGETTRISNDLIRLKDAELTSLRSRLVFVTDQTSTGSGNGWEFNENIDFGLKVASGVNSAFDMGTAVGVHELTKGGRVVRLAEKGAYIGGKTLGKALGGVGIGLTAANLAYEYQTNRINTHSFVDAALTIGTVAAGAVALTVGAPVIAVGAAVVGVGYGIFSIAGGDAWIDNVSGNWGRNVIYGSKSGGR